MASGWTTGERVQLSGSQTATPLLANETYSGAAGALGFVTSATLGAFSGGVGAYAASYDLLGRLTSAAYSYTPTGGSASTLYQTQPTYDALSNVLETTTTLPQGTDTQVFCYDDLSRLTWAGSSGTPACTGAPTPGDSGSLAGTGASYAASYSYDTMNRLTASPLGSYTYGASAHADAATSIGASYTASYDEVGNETCRAAPGSGQTCAGSSPTGALLAYDNEERLYGWQNAQTNPTQSAGFLYDGAGNRVQRVVNTLNPQTGVTTTTTTDYLGALEEVTTSGSTTTTTAYYGSVAESVNGALSYLLSDGLGSVSEAVNTSSGQVTVTQLYAPYGGVRYQSGTLPTERGYTGQVADAASTGLDYYGARYYDPVAGQFTSADTWLAGGLNEDAYVGGNPETKTDPSGHLYANPRNTSRSLAMWQSQNQPHTYYGSLGAFITGLPQFFLGTDTLRQAFHTIFQDPQASAGDKWKAAGVAGLTLVTDAVTITTTFAGDPEVGADMRTFDDGLLATTEVTDETAMAANATDGTALAADGTGGAAGDPGYTVQSTQAEMGGDLTRVGRWMSTEEYEAMTETGMVQEGGGGTTYVAHPADPASYMSQARSGSRYVEFDVPRSSLRPASKVGWAQIPGPNSLYGRLAQMRGEPTPQFPLALNIEWLLNK